MQFSCVDEHKTWNGNDFATSAPADGDYSNSFTAVCGEECMFDGGVNSETETHHASTCTSTASSAPPYGIAFSFERSGVSY